MTSHFLRACDFFSFCVSYFKIASRGSVGMTLPMTNLVRRRKCSRMTTAHRRSTCHKIHKRHWQSCHFMSILHRYRRIFREEWRMVLHTLSQSTYVCKALVNSDPRHCTWVQLKRQRRKGWPRHILHAFLVTVHSYYYFLSHQKKSRIKNVLYTTKNCTRTQLLAQNANRPWGCDTGTMC